MRRVVDACSAFKWVVVEVDSDKALRLRDEFRNGVCDLMALDIFPAEMGSSLLSAQKRGRISNFAPPLFGVLAESVQLHDTTALLPAVARIVASITSGMKFSLYDCLYVALAEREGCELVTADDRLVRVFQKDYPFVTSLSSLP
jgi:predicted nucleic acid-binding protein